jgi:hypothetical protein
MLIFCRNAGGGRLREAERLVVGEVFLSLMFSSSRAPSLALLVEEAKEGLSTVIAWLQHTQIERVGGSEGGREWGGEGGREGRREGGKEKEKER